MNHEKSNKKTGLAEIARSFMYVGKAVNVSKRNLKEFGNRDVKIESDIQRSWTDVKTITQDVREYLVAMKNNDEEDYIIDDMIAAIESGIREYRKITNI